MQSNQDNQTNPSEQYDDDYSKRTEVRASVLEQYCVGVIKSHTNGLRSLLSRGNSRYIFESNMYNHSNSCFHSNYYIKDNVAKELLKQRDNIELMFMGCSNLIDEDEFVTNYPFLCYVICRFDAFPIATAILSKYKKFFDMCSNDISIVSSSSSNDSSNDDDTNHNYNLDIIIDCLSHGKQKDRFASLLYNPHFMLYLLDKKGDIISQNPHIIPHNLQGYLKYFSSPPSSSSSSYSSS